MCVPSLIPAEDLLTYIVLNALISPLGRCYLQFADGEAVFFSPRLLSCCLTAQYVECHAKDLVWNLIGEGLILTLLYTCGVLRTFLNLFESQFLICATELVISASALSFSVSTLRKALCNHPKESYSHLHSHWISSCFNFVIVLVTI